MATIAFLLYGTTVDGRDAFQEEKYQQLATHFQAKGWQVQTVSYCDANRDRVADVLRPVDFTLVWINPIEAGLDRSRLDSMLTGLLGEGRSLSADPAAILKLGTKNILYETADWSWGSDVRRYPDIEDFSRRFPDSVTASRPRVLKQYRGDGGKGVFKVERTAADLYRVIPATDGKVQELSLGGLVALVEPYFRSGNPLLDQEWNENMLNGVVRCYLVGARVAGFGYQEINMLYPGDVTAPSARRRNYYTEKCGLFQDLRLMVEQEIVPKLLARFQLTESSLPVLWDADCFIHGGGRYSLCEVNASCVSPFPESAIPFVYEEVQSRLGR
jgi:hypothetical protein